MKILPAILALCSCITLAQTALPAPAAAQSVKSSDGKFTYELFDSPAPVATIILLHGSSPELPVYREQAQYFAKQGYKVLFPHYFDATRSTAPSTQNYQAWVDVVKELFAEIGKLSSSEKPTPVFLVGYSLGASVALTAGSQSVPATAIADFYGSLPDDFFLHMQAMPPLLILHGQSRHQHPGHERRAVAPPLLPETTHMRPPHLPRSVSRF